MGPGLGRIRAVFCLGNLRVREGSGSFFSWLTVAAVSRAVVAREQVKVACGSSVDRAVPVRPRLAYVGVEAREAGVARHPAVDHVLWVHGHEEVVGTVAVPLPVRRLAYPRTDIVDEAPRRGSAEERPWNVVNEDARRRACGAARHGALACHVLLGATLRNAQTRSAPCWRKPHSVCSEPFPELKSQLTSETTRTT